VSVPGVDGLEASVGIVTIGAIDVDAVAPKVPGRPSRSRPG
jgi:hypothetical protein